MAIPTYVGEILIIGALILANGFFSAAEIAVIAARRGRLQQRADEGDRRAKLALDLASDPARFLATAQVGITLIATFTATFGGANLVGDLGDALQTLPVPLLAANAHGVALVVVGLGITAATLVLGELVPKRLALRRAEQLSRMVAPTMSRLSRWAWPAVWLMSSATNAVLVLLHAEAKAEPSVSVDDIEHLIDTGTAEGVLEPVEKKVALEAAPAVGRADRCATSMRPRIDLDALDTETPAEEVMGAARNGRLLAVAGLWKGTWTMLIIGFIHIKDLFLQQFLGRPIELRRLLRPALLVPETLPLDRLLELFQEKHNQLAIVLDEYGGTEGMVTLEDVVAELVGEIRDEHRRGQIEEFVQRDANSWLVDGRMSLDDFIRKLDLREAAADEPREFSTVSGLILSLLGRIPSVGDSAEWQGLRLEVLDMDGQRIDRILVTRAGENM